MTHRTRHLTHSLALALALPAVACDLPQDIVGETAEAEDPPQDNEDPPQDPPQEPEEPPQDPPQEPEEPPQEPEEPPQDPPQEPDEPDEPQEPVDPPVVEPPSDEPTIVLTDLAGTLAVDESWLFVGGDELPVRVVKSGGAPEPVVPDALVDPALIAETDSVQLIVLDDTDVYWSAYVGGFPQFRLLRAPKTGGPATLVTDEPGPNSAVPAAFAVDDEFVYLAMPDIYNANDGFDKLNGVVRRVPKAGGPALDLAQVYTQDVAVSDAYVYWPRPRKLGGSELVRAQKDGSDPQVITVELGTIYDVQVVGGRLYWSLFDADQYIARTALEGEEATTLLTDSGEDFYFGTPAVTTDAVYWLRPGGADSGGVLSLDLAGNFSELATAPASLNYTPAWGTYGTRVAADDSAVYWAYESGQGGAPRIYRVAR